MHHSITPDKRLSQVIKRLLLPVYQETAYEGCCCNPSKSSARAGDLGRRVGTEVCAPSLDLFVANPLLNPTTGRNDVIVSKQTCKSILVVPLTDR